MKKTAMYCVELYSVYNDMLVCVAGLEDSVAEPSVLLREPQESELVVSRSRGEFSSTRDAISLKFRSIFD